MLFPRINFLWLTSSIKAVTTKGMHFCTQTTSTHSHGHDQTIPKVDNQVNNNDSGYVQYVCFKFNNQKVHQLFQNHRILQSSFEIIITQFYKMQKVSGVFQTFTKNYFVRIDHYFISPE